MFFADSCAAALQDTHIAAEGSTEIEAGAQADPGAIAQSAIHAHHPVVGFPGIALAGLQGDQREHPRLGIGART